MRIIEKYFVLGTLCLLTACVPTQYLKPVDRSVSDIRNYKGIMNMELPKGKEWYFLADKNGTTVYGKKLKDNDHTFLASMTAGEVGYTFKDRESFLKFVRSSRASGTNPERFDVLLHDEILDPKHGEYCTKYKYKANETGKGILELNGYTCLHPKYPQYIFTIEYSERWKDNRVSDSVRLEGVNFIESIKFTWRGKDS